MNKKAVATLIAYVLLVAMTVAMAGITYSWLKFYVQKPFVEEKCPDVSLVLAEYKCDINKTAEFVVQNRGMFYVDGYLVRINNGTKDYAMPYTTNLANPLDTASYRTYVDKKMDPNQKSTALFNYSYFNRINELEIEAIRGFDKYGRPVLCKDSITRQPILNCA